MKLYNLSFFLTQQGNLLTVQDNKVAIKMLNYLLASCLGLHISTYLKILFIQHILFFKFQMKFSIKILCFKYVILY